jgi:hypothetical protein
MPQVVSAVVSNAWRTKLAQIYANAASFSLPSSFKIGEGGWTNPGGGKEPVPPSVTQTDLRVITNPGDYPSDSQYYFTKALTGGDLTFTSPTRLQIRCFVAANEANDDGNGLAPEFFELAVFDNDGTILVYSTFPIEIKTDSKSLEHLIYVDF